MCCNETCIETQSNSKGVLFSVEIYRSMVNKVRDIITFFIEHLLPEKKTWQIFKKLQISTLCSFFTSRILFTKITHGLQFS